MQDCHAITIPMEPSLVGLLSKKSKEEHSDMKDIPYKNAIGQLMYLSTKPIPDIATAVGLISRQVGCPQPHYWTAVKSLLRYLRGTANLVIAMTPPAKPIFYARSDADRAGENDRVSISDYLSRSGMFLLHGAARSRQLLHFHQPNVNITPYPQPPKP